MAVGDCHCGWIGGEALIEKSERRGLDRQQVGCSCSNECLVKAVVMASRHSQRSSLFGVERNSIQSGRSNGSRSRSGRHSCLHETLATHRQGRCRNGGQCCLYSDREALCPRRPNVTSESGLASESNAEPQLPDFNFTISHHHRLLLHHFLGASRHDLRRFILAQMTTQTLQSFSRRAG